MAAAPEWQETLRGELEGVDRRLSELGLAELTQRRHRVVLAAAAERRTQDRWTAIRALGRNVRRVEPCRPVIGGEARPKRCPGCGVTVVDPRGATAAEISTRLGATDWVARSDGLLARAECTPRVRARRTRNRWLGIALALVVLAFLAATASMVTLAS